MGIDTHRSDAVLEDFGSFFDGENFRKRTSVEAFTGLEEFKDPSSRIADVKGKTGTRVKEVMAPWMVDKIGKKRQ